MTSHNIKKVREDLLAAHAAAVKSVKGDQCVYRHLQQHPFKASHIVAVGKAASSMLAGALKFYSEQNGISLKVLLITKHHHVEPIDQGFEELMDSFEAIESSHPIPDHTSLHAGQRLVAFVTEIKSKDNLLVLTSGGASALCEYLQQPRDFDENVNEETDSRIDNQVKLLSRVNNWLMSSGLAIADVNRVRKNISTIKGGRLANLVQSKQTLNLLISDVPGDDKKVIGSGLFIPHEQADISVDHIKLPAWLMTIVKQAMPLTDNDKFDNINSHIVAANKTAIQVCASHLQALGYQVNLAAEFLDCDVNEAAQMIVKKSSELRRQVIIYGGEVTVLLPDSPGQGGRSQALALATALGIHKGLEMDKGLGIDNKLANQQQNTVDTTNMEKNSDWVFLAAGTDGTDGPGHAAGAIVDSSTITNGRNLGFDSEQYLLQADSGSYLEATNDLVVTGPTGTNVMDIAIMAKL